MEETHQELGVEALNVQPDPVRFDWLWGYFIPLGFFLVIWGGLSPRKARRVTPVAALALALSTLAYWSVGFALHLGGAYAVTGNQALEGLQALLLMVPEDPNWGVAGLTGLFLAGQEFGPEVYTLFLTYLPLVTTAVILTSLALANLRRWVMLMASLLMGAIVFPVAACWSWGGGWLAHLGDSMALGYGFVDFGGSALVLWLPGIFVLALWLLQGRDRATQPPEPPSTYAPLLANLGAILVGIGWLGWELSQPFHMLPATLDWHRVALNTLLGMAGATLAAQLYAWLATGHPESLLASQGQIAGWGAVLASAPFVPGWAALALGTLAGFAFPLVRYAIEAWLHLRDTAGTIALALTSGPLGLLGVALFADGQAGQGWNGYPASSPLPGVAGLFVSGDTAQLSAQAIGLLAFTLWAAFWGLLLGAASRLSTHNPTTMQHTPATAAAAQPPHERTETVAEEGPLDETSSVAPSAQGPEQILASQASSPSTEQRGKITL